MVKQPKTPRNLIIDIDIALSLSTQVLPNGIFTMNFRINGLSLTEI